MLLNSLQEHVTKSQNTAQAAEHACTTGIVDQINHLFGPAVLRASGDHAPLQTVGTLCPNAGEGLSSIITSAGNCEP